MSLRPLKNHGQEVLDEWQPYVVEHFVHSSKYLSLDWFQRKCTGNNHILLGTKWFPVDVPLNQSDESIEMH